MSEMYLKKQCDAIDELIYGIESIKRDTDSLKEWLDGSIEYLRYNGLRQEITERTNEIVNEIVNRDLARLIERMVSDDVDYLYRVKSHLDKARRR